MITTPITTVATLDILTAFESRQSGRASMKEEGGKRKIGKKVGIKKKTP